MPKVEKAPDVTAGNQLCDATTNFRKTTSDAYEVDEPYCIEIIDDRFIIFYDKFVKNDKYINWSPITP